MRFGLLFRTPIDFFHFNTQSLRFATKKAGGSTKNGRDSPGQRLGVKKFGGEVVVPGNIIIRQRGQQYRCGENVKMGKDHTIYSISEGFVRFEWDTSRKRQVVHVSAANPNTPRTVFDRHLKRQVKAQAVGNSKGDLNSMFA